MHTFQELIANHSLRCCAEEPWYAIIEMDTEQGRQSECREVHFWWPMSLGVEGSYADPEEWRASDLDVEGNCLLRVPMANVWGMMPETEALHWMEMRDAADRMLSYAR